jgi:streptogramin lyase
VYISQFGSSGSGNGQFSGPYGITLDSLGNIYVADVSNNRIQKFDSNGVYISQFGSSGSGNGQFNFPYYITLDSLGNMFVSDYYNHRIQKFDSNGVYISQFGSNGSGNGQFNYTTGITLDSLGNIYVADGGNNRIQKFDSNGVYISQFGSYGSGNGQFNFPSNIILDTLGNMYVADYLNHRIQKFIYITLGCTNTRATNFNSVANRDNGLCTLPVSTGMIVGSGPSAISPAGLPGYVKPRPQIVYPDGKIVYLDEPGNQATTTIAILTTESKPTSTFPPITTSIKSQTTGVVVKSLQQILNSLGFTLTQTGPGSPGNETEVFGALTRQAVQKFQCEKKIICSGTPSTTGYGQVGPRTREAINNAIKDKNEINTQF